MKIQGQQFQKRSFELEPKQNKGKEDKKAI